MALSGVVVVGCKSSGGGADPAGPTVVSEDVFRWSAQQAVNAVLLTENDLPASFDLVVDEADEEDEDGPPVQFTGDCAQFNDLANIEDNFLAAVAEGETGDFENEDEDGFSSNAGAFRDAATAEEEATRFQRLVSTCSDQMEAYFTQYFQDEAATGETAITSATIDVREIVVPHQGDWVHGMRTDMTFDVSGTQVRFVSDSVSIRVGQMIATVDYTYSQNPDEALRDGIVATIAARLAAEEAKLPS
jgi:hypothetical protein